ncbi:MAG: MFS transporter [Deltaproteobacteria bacterium]|nr:MAG: MFS transporter [Deltaproteobacteria bacterium]
MVETPNPAPVRGARPMLVAFVTVLLDLLGFGIIIPIQPFYAEHLGASPTLVTLLGASYSLMQFLFAPMWGRLSDRIGRRPVMLTSISISIVGYAIFASADTLWVLFASRMLAGFGAANIGAAQAIVADTTSGKDRAKGMGLIGAAFGIGFIIGPAMGGALGQLGPEAPAWGAAILSALNLGLALRFLPETRKVGEAAAGHGRRSIISFHAIGEIAGRINVGRLLLIVLVSVTGMALMEQALPLFIERLFVPFASYAAGSPEAHARAAALTAYVLVAVGLTATIVQGGLIGRLTKRYGERTLIRVGSALMGIALALMPVAGAADSFAGLIGSGVLLALGSGMMNPSIMSFLSRSVSSDVQGAALGLSQSLSALGRTIGPAFSGLLFEAGHEIPFFSAAGTLLVAVIVALGLKKLIDVSEHKA